MHDFRGKTAVITGAASGIGLGMARAFGREGMNVVVADTSENAQEQFHTAKLSRVAALFGRGRSFSDEEAEAILNSPAGKHIEQMTKYSALGTPEEVKDYIEAFAKHADADELIVAHQSPTTDARLRSVELLADSVINSGAL